MPKLGLETPTVPRFNAISASWLIHDLEQIAFLNLNFHVCKMKLTVISFVTFILHTFIEHRVCANRCAKTGDPATNKPFGMCQDPKINDGPCPLLPPPLWVCPTAPEPWPCTHV